MSIPFRAHTQSVLYQLHWHQIKYWIRFRVLVLTFKAPNCLGPGGRAINLIHAYIKVFKGHFPYEGRSWILGHLFFENRDIKRRIVSVKVCKIRNKM